MTRQKKIMLTSWIVHLFIPWLEPADERLCWSTGTGCRKEQMNRCSELQDSSPRPVLSGSNQILHGIASPFFYVSQPTAFSLSASASTILQETLLNKHCGAGWHSRWTSLHRLTVASSRKSMVLKFSNILDNRKMMEKYLKLIIKHVDPSLGQKNGFSP